MMRKMNTLLLAYSLHHVRSRVTFGPTPLRSPGSVPGPAANSDLHIVHRRVLHLFEWSVGKYCERKCFSASAAEGKVRGVFRNVV